MKPHESPTSTQPSPEDASVAYEYSFTTSRPATFSVPSSRWAIAGQSATSARENFVRRAGAWPEEIVGIAHDADAHDVVRERDVPEPGAVR